MSSVRRITLRKEKKGVWDNTADSWEIRYKDETMGRVNMVTNGFCIVLRVPKTMADFAVEPNCVWKWVRMDCIFPTFAEVKTFLNLHKNELKDRFDNLFEIEEMARHGTLK